MYGKNTVRKIIRICFGLLKNVIFLLCKINLVNRLQLFFFGFLEVFLGMVGNQSKRRMI